MLLPQIFIDETIRDQTRGRIDSVQGNIDAIFSSNTPASSLLCARSYTWIVVKGVSYFRRVRRNGYSIYMKIARNERDTITADLQTLANGQWPILLLF